MLDKVKIAYIIAITTIFLSFVIFAIYDNFNLTSFYYLSSCLFIIFPFLSLFFILFLNLKKITYQARKYDEASLVSLIIVGTLWLYLYTILGTYLNIVIAYAISGLIFVIILIIFIILNKFFGKVTNGAKIVRNK